MSNKQLKNKIMILYKVTGARYKESDYPEIEFIVAQKPSTAINKFTELHPSCKYLSAIEICQRDIIIPTVEPIKEKI